VKETNGVAVTSVWQAAARTKQREVTTKSTSRTNHEARPTAVTGDYQQLYTCFTLFIAKGQKVDLPLRLQKGFFSGPLNKTPPSALA